MSLVLSYDPDLSTRDAQDRTALDLARQAGVAEMVELITNHVPNRCTDFSANARAMLIRYRKEICAVAAIATAVTYAMNQNSKSPQRLVIS